MNKIKTQIRRFIYVVKHDYLSPVNIAFCITIIFCIAWTYGSIISTTRNWKLSEEIVSKQKELSMLELEIETMELENIYYNSDEYKELAARAKDNRKLPGETMILLSANSEQAKNKYISDLDLTIEETSNVAKWLSFLFRI